MTRIRLSSRVTVDDWMYKITLRGAEKDQKNPEILALAKDRKSISRYQRSPTVITIITTIIIINDRSNIFCLFFLFYWGYVSVFGLLWADYWIET